MTTSPLSPAATFEITSLGHQGWLFSSGTSRLLVDPLLTSRVGHGGCVGDVFPPRVFSFDALPAIDALFLTHEHEDHFDIPSLARIDRAVPVLLSSHSSMAAERFLRELGFEVTRVRPGQRVAIGDLELFVFAPQFVDQSASDEWDVLPFLVRDGRGDGSFFSSVDVAMHDGIEQALRALQETPPVWCYTNNALDLSPFTAGKVLETEPADTSLIARNVIGQYAGLCTRWGVPPAVLMCGGGLSFTDDRAWLNQSAFRGDSARVCASLATLSPGRTFRAVIPGETLVMRGGALAELRAECAFLKCPPPDEWPSRTPTTDAPPLVQDYAPFTPARDVAPEELEELTELLAGFAQHLYGKPTFRGLYSLSEAELAGRRPTFSLVALCDDEGGSYVYEYDPTACAFVQARAEDPVADYVGGVECWAGDLLAVLRGEICVSAISFGRGRSWSALPEQCPIRWHELVYYCHPLRDPNGALAFYRRLLTDCGDVPIEVRASQTHTPVVGPAMEPATASAPPTPSADASPDR